MSVQLPEGLDPLRYAPIFLASTHGIYNVDPPIRKFRVPPNIFIFETSNICQTTLMTMDQPLWELVAGENRDLFLQYFTNALGATQKKYRKLFQNIHFYKPGDEIYERKLSLIGGKEGRTSFASLGFFHFPIESKLEDLPIVGKKRPSSSMLVLEPLRSLLIQGSNKINENTYLEDVHITNEEFIKKHVFSFYPDAKKSSIFIFSSCAGVECTGTTPKERKECDERIHQIEQHQHAQDLQALELGLANPLLSSSIQPIPLPRNMPSRKGKVGQSFAPTANLDYNSNNEPYYGENTYRRPAPNMLYKSDPESPKGKLPLYAIQVANTQDPPKRIDPKYLVSKIIHIPAPDGTPYFGEREIQTFMKDSKSHKYPHCRFYTLKDKQYFLLEETRETNTVKRGSTKKSRLQRTRKRGT